MTAALDVLAMARRHGVEVEIHGNQLRLHAASEPPSDVLTALREHKAEIVATLSEPLDEERAGIIQHDGAAPLAWADGLARLDPNSPPGDVPPQRWVTFCNDAGRFLDEWAYRAAALGWGPADLFGCDTRKPFARVDRLGLVWLLKGDRLVALSETTAVIQRGTGARQSCRRRPVEPGCVLVWDLAS